MKAQVLILCAVFILRCSSGQKYTCSDGQQVLAAVFDEYSPLCDRKVSAYSKWRILYITFIIRFIFRQLHTTKCFLYLCFGRNISNVELLLNKTGRMGYLKNGPFPASFSLFYLPMTGFEPRTSVIGSSTNWATTTALRIGYFKSNQ